ncbi:MAG: class I SAM-dependent methyltransferase [bacterium]|nr:class I SAM-dependent methyltransferase [bacterium]
MQKKLPKRKPYGVGPLVYNGEIYDGQFPRKNEDFPFYKKWCLKTGGPVLELCCGTGRLTIPLAHAGVDITGLDMTPAMLNRAKIKRDAKGLDINLIKGDMRRFKLGRRFKLIFVPFNSIQNTYALKDIENIFARVKEHLASDGVFILDIFNPSIKILASSGAPSKTIERFILPDGRKVIIKEKHIYDVAAQINRVTWYYSINGKRTPGQQLDMRCFFPQEMDALLKYNGFEVIKKFGNYNEIPFGSASPKQIYVLKKKVKR